MPKSCGGPSIADTGRKDTSHKVTGGRGLLKTFADLGQKKTHL